MSNNKNNPINYSNITKNEFVAEEFSEIEVTKEPKEVEEISEIEVTKETKEVEEIVEESIDPPAEPMFGTVTDCKMLNVRSEPSAKAKISSVVSNGDRLMVNLANSTDDWLNVYTEAGIEGYCMKKYLVIE